MKQMQKLKESIIDEKFNDLRQLVKATIRSKDVHGLIVIGSPGIGKTTNVISELERNGLDNGQDYVVFTSYMTPLELYNQLYVNHDKIIVFDDIMKIFDNDMTRGILQAALWNPKGKRYINYYSTSKRLTAPSEIEFKGKIIWCTNKFPESANAIRSRVFYYELNLSYDDKIKLMYEVCRLHKIPKEIPEYIHNRTKYGKDAFEVDFRILFKLFALYKINKDWKSFTLKLIKVDQDKLSVIDASKDSNNIKEACYKWCEMTGKSRATFFRLKRSLGKII